MCLSPVQMYSLLLVQDLLVLENSKHGYTVRTHMYAGVHMYKNACVHARMHGNAYNTLNGTDKPRDKLI